MENGEENPSWLVGDGTVDYKGQPADKRRTGGWKAAPLIFGTVISSSREQSNPCCAKVGVPIVALPTPPKILAIEWEQEISHLDSNSESRILSITSSKNWS
jgi:hypothetical protein